jgi:hypothetical protein
METYSGRGGAYNRAWLKPQILLPLLPTVIDPIVMIGSQMQEARDICTPSETH